MTGILIDSETGDLLVGNGGIETGDNTGQCVEQVLRANRGEYKEFPLVGGEVVKLIHGNQSRFWAGRARNMCVAMGVDVKRVDVHGNGKIEVVL